MQIPLTSLVKVTREKERRDNRVDASSRLERAAKKGSETGDRGRSCKNGKNIEEVPPSLGERGGAPMVAYRNNSGRSSLRWNHPPPVLPLVAVKPGRSPPYRSNESSRA